MRYVLIIEDMDDPVDFQYVSELEQWIQENKEALQFDEMEEGELG